MYMCMYKVVVNPGNHSGTCTGTPSLVPRLPELFNVSCSIEKLGRGPGSEIRHTCTYMYMYMYICIHIHTYMYICTPCTCIVLLLIGVD